MARRFSYTLHLSGVAYDITPIADSSTFTYVSPLCSNEKKSGNGTASVTIKGGADPTKYRNLMVALLNSQVTKTVGDCLFIVTDLSSNEVVHRGYLNMDELSISSAHFPDALVLASRDKSTLLDSKIRLNQYWENESRNTIVEDLLDALALETGQTVSYLSSELSDDEKVGHFAVAEGREETYRDVIDTLLMEAVGYVLWFDHQYDGYRIRKIPVDYNPQQTYRVVTYRVENKLVTQSKVYENDGVLLAYPTIVERQNTNVFTEGINLSIDDGGVVTGESVPSGEHFPFGGDVKEIYQEYSVPDRAYVSGVSRVENEDLELLYAKNVSYQLTSNPQLSLAGVLPNVGWYGTPQFYPDRARILFVNNNVNNSNVTVFSITGTAVYISALNRITVPSNCAKPEEFTVKTITDSVKAKAFADWYYNSQRYGCTTSKWAEPEGYSHLGEIVLVRHKDTGIEMPHVIVQITDSNAGGASGTIRLKEIVALSLYGWQAVLSQTTPRMTSPSVNKPQGVRWYNGTVLSGTTTARGVAGNYGDYYLNTETGDIYRCITSGDAVTALWQWVMNNKGDDATVDGMTYELEYGLSTSDSEFIFPEGSWGFENVSEENYGALDTNDNVMEFGFEDHAWSPTVDGWYRGLYVWQRIKVTDVDGNVTYEEPVYCKDITDSLIASCTFELVPTNETYLVNKASSEIDTYEISLVFTCYPPSYQNDPISYFVVTNTSGDIITSSEIGQRKSGHYILLSIPRNTSREQLTITAVGRFDEVAVCQMIANDQTVIDAFAGRFPSDADAQLFFVNNFGGVMDGYTYAYDDPSDPDNPNRFALRTYVQGVGWKYLTEANFDVARVSMICGKAQQSVLSQVQEGSVTAKDFGFFNIIIAKIINADFIGSQQIQIQNDPETGVAGRIYGGAYDGNGNLTDPNGQGFYLDATGTFKVYSANIVNITISGDSIFEGTIESEVFKTNLDATQQGDNYKASSNGKTPSAYRGSELATYINNHPSMSSGTRYSMSGQIGGTELCGGVYFSSTPSRTILFQETSVKFTVTYTKSFDPSPIARRVRVYGTTSQDGNFVYKWHTPYVTITIGGSSYTVVSRATGDDFWDGAISHQKNFDSSYDVPPNTAFSVTIEGETYSFNTWYGNYYVSDEVPSICSAGLNFFKSGSMTRYTPSSLLPNTYYTSTPTAQFNGSTPWSWNISSASAYPSGVYPLYTFSWDTGYAPPASGTASIFYTAPLFTLVDSTGATRSPVATDYVEWSLTSVMANGSDVYALSSTIYVRSYNVDIVLADAPKGVYLGNTFPRTRGSQPDIGTSDDRFGDIYAVNLYGTVHGSSLKRLKENIVPYEGDALSVVVGTKICRFTYKNDKKRIPHYGFIADDTAEELSTPNHNVMDYTSCIGIMMKAIQELSSEIEELKRKIDGGE